MYKLLPFILFLSVQLWGQSPFKTELIQFTDGLPSDVVYMTLKKDGFLYIATQRGLCMYDGYSFITSRNLQYTIFNISEKNGKIRGMEHGIGLFETDDIYDEKRVIAAVNYFDTTQDNDHHHNIYTDDNGNIWCTDFHFIKYYNPASNKHQEFRVSDFNTTIDLSISYLETPEEITIPTNKGLFVWEKNNGNWVKLSDGRFSSAIKTNGRFLLLSVTGELSEYMPHERKWTPIQTLPVEQNFQIVKDYKTNGELILYDENSIHQYSLANNSLRSIFDSEDQINHVFYDDVTRIFWVSTQRGLVKLYSEGGAIQTVSLPQTDPSPITDFIEDDKSQIWMVQEPDKLFVYHDGKTRQIIVHNEILGRLSFAGNRMLLGTGSGVYLKDENDTFKKILATTFPVKKAILYDDKYWVMPETGVIRVYDVTTLHEFQDYIKNDEKFWTINLFNDMEISHDNKLWLANWMPQDHGISWFSETERKFVQISTIVKDRTIFVADYFNRISRLQNGNMVFSATGGFNIVNPKGEIVYSMFPRQNSVVCDNIVGIGEDRKGNIWFGCAEGLFLFNIQTNTPVRISRIDGLSSNNLSYGFFISKNNTLFVSNEKTVEKINLDEILKTKLINELKLTAIKVNGNYLPDITHNLSLKEKAAPQIELFFSALNFSQKEKLIYRYKFDQEDWNYLGHNPHLSLIKLTPGKYQVTIEAGDNLGNWQPKTLEMAIEIIPPFHKTYWFYVLLFTCFFIGAHFFNVYLVRQEKVKGELKKMLKENENKMLRSQMNPHFLFNSLNSINSFIIQNKTEEAEKYLTSFSKLMRNILDNSRKESISLRQELETVKLYLDLEAVRLENKFDYRINVSKDVDVEFVQIPPLILQPFLENAIWHGINHKKGEGFINIDVENSQDNNSLLIIKIKDDGIGRKAASRNRKSEIAHKSYGITITQERLGLLGSDNSVEITDVYDEFKQPAGTLVTFKIHIKNDQSDSH